jgi:Arc/MetJ-type ribon-helix-helix transcriptional regulator
MPTTLTISLPDDLRAALDEQVSSGAYASREAYIQELIRRDQLLGDREHLQAQLLQRADDRDSVLMDQADVARLRDELKRRVGGRGGQ